MKSNILIGPKKLLRSIEIIGELNPTHILLEGTRKEYPKRLRQELEKLVPRITYLDESNEDFYRMWKKKRKVYRNFIKILDELYQLRLKLGEKIEQHGEDFVRFLLEIYHMDLESLEEFKASELLCFKELMEDVLNGINAHSCRRDVYWAQEMLNLTLDKASRILVICGKRHMKSEPHRLVWYLEKRGVSFEIVSP